MLLHSVSRCSRWSRSADEGVVDVAMTTGVVAVVAVVGAAMGAADAETANHTYSV